MMSKSKNAGLLAFGIFSLLWVSLMKSDLFSEGYIVPKYYNFAFLFIPWIILLIYDTYTSKRESLIEITKLDVFVLLFYVYSLIRLIFTNHEPVLHPEIINHTFLLLLYWVVKRGINGYNSNDHQRYVGYFAIYGLVILLVNALYGLLENVGSLPPSHPHFKIGGSFGNPGPYSNFLVTMLPIGAMVLMNRQLFSKRVWWLAIAAVTTFLIILPFTKARTAWVATLMVGLIYFIMFVVNTPRCKQWIKHTSVKVSGIVVLVLMSIMIVYGLLSFKQDSASGRLFMWGLSLKMIQDKPLVGHGYDSFCYQLNQYQANFFEKNGDDLPVAQIADNATYAFNEFIQVGVELGLVGLLLFLMVLYYAFQSKMQVVYKQDKYRFTLFYCVKVIIAAIVVCSLFSYPLHNLPIVTMFYIGLAIISGNSEHVSSKRIVIHPGFKKVVAGVLAVGAVYVFSIIVSRYNGEKEWGTLIRDKKLYSPQRLRDEYKSLEAVMNYNKYFAFNYGAEMIASGQFQEGTLVLQQALLRLNDSNIHIYLAHGYDEMGQLDKAISLFTNASNIVPSKIFPLYNLVKLYDKTGHKEKAVDIATKIINKGEKVETDIGNGIMTEMREYVVSK